MAAYPFKQIEAKWQAHWESQATFRVPDKLDTSKPKYYVLDMFPYPVGRRAARRPSRGLHGVRHRRALQAHARVQRAAPDGLGRVRAAGRAVRDQDRHASARSRRERNVNRFREQLKSLGFSYDWDREVDTTDPGYYKWTQWIFLQLFERGLAYQEEVPVWWCPELGTSLANEEVIDGKSEVGGFAVRAPAAAPVGAEDHRVRRRAARRTSTASTGRAARRRCSATGSAAAKAPRSTSPSTATPARRCASSRRGPTRCSARPTWCSRPSTSSSRKLTTPSTARRGRRVSRRGVAQERAASARSSQKEKTGVFTGALRHQPGQRASTIPIWIADYVLAGYGTGAIMAVPGARPARLRVRAEIRLARRSARCSRRPTSTARARGRGDGVVDQQRLLERQERRASESRDDRVARARGQRRAARQLQAARLAVLAAALLGRAVPDRVRRRQAASRARRASCPCGCPSSRTSSRAARRKAPLAKAGAWLETVDAEDRQDGAPRDEHDAAVGRLVLVLPALHRPARTTSALIDPALEKYWLPVDLYVGGAEHAVLHLLYARFWHKVLYDAGVVSTPEPFMKLVHQGMILGELEFTVNGERVAEEHVEKQGDRFVLRDDPTVTVEARAHKMSKARGNVVNPDEIVARLRRRRVPALRDVHGAARASEAVEHARRRGHAPVPEPRVAARRRRRRRRRRQRAGARRRGADARASSGSCTRRSRRSPKTSRRCASTRRSRR